MHAIGIINKQKTIIVLHSQLKKTMFYILKRIVCTLFFFFKLIHFQLNIKQFFKKILNKKK